MNLKFEKIIIIEIIKLKKIIGNLKIVSIKFINIIFKFNIVKFSKNIECIFLKSNVLCKPTVRLLISKIKKRIKTIKVKKAKFIILVFKENFEKIVINKYIKNEKTTPSFLVQIIKLDVINIINKYFNSVLFSQIIQ